MRRHVLSDPNGHQAHTVMTRWVVRQLYVTAVCKVPVDWHVSGVQLTQLYVTGSGETGEFPSELRPWQTADCCSDLCDPARSCKRHPLDIHITCKKSKVLIGW